MEDRCARIILVAPRHETDFVFLSACLLAVIEDADD